jgi:hypothetical protein
MAETPTLTITLTKEQALQVLVATGLMVHTLELPLAVPADGEEAVARIPIPDFLKAAAPAASGEPVTESDLADNGTGGEEKACLSW